MEKGLIGFVFSKKTIISRFISFFRDGMIVNPAPTHCFVVMHEVDGEILVGEAKWPLIRLSNIKVHLHDKTRLEIYRPEVVSPNKRRNAFKLILKNMGQPYGTKRALGFIWVWLADKFGKKVDNPIDNGIICSTVVWKYLKLVDYPDQSLMNMKPQNVAMGHIYKSIKDMPQTRLVAVSNYGSSELIEVSE